MTHHAARLSTYPTHTNRTPAHGRGGAMRRAAWWTWWARRGAVTSVAISSVLASGQPEPVRGFSEASSRAYLAFERDLNTIPTAERLRQWHDLTASEPHIAGTEGDARQIDRLRAAFEGMGLATEVHEFWTYLSLPVAGEVEVLGEGGGAIETREAVLPEDSFTSDPRLGFAWNGYSGSGEVASSVVYANYGSLADFAKLRELGVEVSGRVVLVRYGGIFRGSKVRNAEAAGAAAVLLYTDPADTGYARGLMYPEGGYQTPTCIQRGSIKTLDYPGDPLTPFREATFDAERLDPSAVALPRIPVQPIGWAGAKAILDRLDGPAVPGGWQGGLPLAYRTHGSAESCTVRVRVEQRREIVRSANVIATLPGAIEPQRSVLIGCHHDAWGFGASDPAAGLISMMESARSFAEMARRGQRPRRTIVFAAWGAEEHGIIGSVEYVERERDRLHAGAVAYLNLDMASMGPDFGSAASPSLRTVIAQAARRVPQARAPERTVFDAWSARGRDASRGEPAFGELGGGSDHIGFWCHVGVASASLGGSGSPGTAYHTAYDTLAWYRKIVGEDYEPALMVARMTNAVAGQVAQAEVTPLDPARTAAAARDAALALPKASAVAGSEATGEADAAPSALDLLRTRAEAWAVAADTLERRIGLLTRSGVLGPAAVERLNAALLELDRAWVDSAGLAGRPWFRNVYAATDPESGYGAWVLPGLRGATESDDAAAIDEAARQCLAVYDRLDAALRRANEATEQ